MSKLPGPLEILSQLERLQAGFQACASQTREAEQAFERDLSRLDRQLQHDRRQTEEDLAAARAEIQAAFEARQNALQTHSQQRQARISAASQAAEDRRLKNIENDEARRVFQIQRDLLQISRNREVAAQQADAQYAGFMEEWDREADILRSLEQRTYAAFRGYRRFRRWLGTGSAEASPPGLPTDADEALQRAGSQLHQAEEALRRFRRLPLPRLFSALPAWLILLILALLHAGAVPLLQFVNGFHASGTQVAVSFLALAAGILALHFLGRQLAGHGAQALARSIHQAKAAHAAAGTAATGRHQATHAQLQQEAQAQTAAYEQEWSQTVETANAQRNSVRGRFEAKRNRALARNDRLRSRALTCLDADRQTRIDQLNQNAQIELDRLQKDYTDKRKTLEARRQSHRERLDTELRRATEPVYAELGEVCRTTRRLYPPWNEPAWQKWQPPTEFFAAAPFGLLTVDVARLSEVVPAEPSLKLPGPGRLQLPLLLTFPAAGSILLETRERGRDQAVAALNNLVLRLLSGAPPGRIAFTILDPVSLGQNFAGLMHLTDHSDRLINRRIWTQPEHIEQQLADLNGHIEKVTQLYLRNEYATIAEYNLQAGRVAEPYHFLVVADFPVSFSDLAVRRLLSIAASGPRCGVFPLIHWDRRKPAPAELAAEELSRNGAWLRSHGEGFVLVGKSLPGTTLELAAPPDNTLTTSLLQQIGQSSVDAYRVELPFELIAPPVADRWSLGSATEVRVPIGVTGATKFQHLALGKGTRQHALLAGKTGSGKSTLFHVLITNLALWYGPDQVEFYLVDFKKGVEFKCYAAHQLPHARVVAIESDREFGLSVLQRLDDELRRRGDLFRQLGAQDLPNYRRAAGTEPLPRTLLIIDEFQEFFTDDDRVAQNAALLLDRLVRQGRAFGIHILLGSQTLGGAYTLARTTLGQMVVRIALQCNQADALLIMDEDNPAPRLLTRPGEAIYNDAAGTIEGNIPFQVAWLSDEGRETQLQTIRQHAEQTLADYPRPVIFEGNAPASVRENPSLAALLAARSVQTQSVPRVWLGAPNSIKGPTEVALGRQSGHHLLIVGLYEESVLALLVISILSLAAQHSSGTVRFIVLDSGPPDSPARRLLAQLPDLVPHQTVLAGPAELGEVMADLSGELSQRVDSGRTAPAVYLFIHHLQRFKSLRYEDDFALSLESADSAGNPGLQLNRLLTEGAPLGLHVWCACDTYNNTTRFLSRKALSEFELRVLFQMSANDSASLIDSPRAASLGLHRAVLYNAQQGRLETFRPYGLPDQAWLEEVKHQLARLLL